ncbi:MAG: hypothetical protein F8N36_15330 [Desulfovibrio sp.]|uniref:DNA-directed RNA polymerase subunit alpha C-terminal domain-containing protein n=1 Tax=Desulfovibrio sp. TaxID=885 RepID=UPI00135E451A|nr:DNA-directed RNA polymerase subunit alpha C-terminal domain-containing protein [Desulfovibrio sp.]MTJ94213.1 hypothetical protein [Desulfovibrio sp.]
MTAENFSRLVPDILEMDSGDMTPAVAANGEPLNRRLPGAQGPSAQLIIQSGTNDDGDEPPKISTLVDLQNRDREIATAAANVRAGGRKTNKEVAAELGISPEALVRIETRERKRLQLLAQGDYFVELTTRTKRSLNDEGITSLTDLLRFSARTLVKGVPNLGKKGVAEVVALLEKHGLSLLPD